MRRCYHCDSTDHLVAGCPHKAAQNHKAEVAAAVQAYYEGGTEIFAAWEVVNQFTPAEALTWDAANEIFMVTEHQEALAKQAARQWSAGMAAVCACKVLSTAVCDKVALDTDGRQLAAGSEGERRTIPQLMNRNHCVREKAVTAEPMRLQPSCCTEQQQAVAAVPAVLTLHCTTEHVLAEPQTVQTAQRLLAQQQPTLQLTEQNKYSTAQQYDRARYNKAAYNQPIAVPIRQLHETKEQNSSVMQRMKDEQQGENLRHSVTSLVGCAGEGATEMVIALPGRLKEHSAVSNSWDAWHDTPKTSTLKSSFKFRVMAVENTHTHSHWRRTWRRT